MSTDRKVFDVKAFLANFSGMEDIAYSAVESFLQTLPKLTQDIESAIQAKDPKKIEMTAHTLKGSVSNFYAEPCRELAYKIEKIGNKKILEENELNESFERLKLELISLEKELNAFFAEKKSA